MYILAYKDGHDPAACLLKDGHIVAAVEEERFNRIKHAPSYFPRESIAFCLHAAGITEAEVDHVVYARLRPLRTMFVVFSYYLRRPPRSAIELRYAVANILVQIRGSFSQLVGKAGHQRLAKEFPRLPRQVAPFDHHLCHAASAYLYSSFDEAVTITWDGKGEATSCAISVGKGATLKVKERRGIFDSLGLLYSAATEYLGFTPNDGEYKVMGLAPYGKRGVLMNDIVAPDAARGYKVNSDFVLYPFARQSWERRFGKARAREAALSKEQTDMAYSLQQSLEEVGLSLARTAATRYGAKYACFAGGVALNVKLNKVLRESGIFEDIFIQPAAGDNGLVLGAAGLLYTRLTGKRPEPLSTLYLGTAYSDDEIAKILKDEGVVYERVQDVAAATADLLAEGKAVAWFQDRMEFGPRALGARSVIANPAEAGMRDRINEKIKFREEFRPFCPSILEERAGELLERPGPSPYMILSFDATEQAKRAVPAVVHVDGTVRPQTVSKNGTRYRALLETFYAKTGVPALLNTSLNIRGEPIVEHPAQVVEFFRKTYVDAVVAGDCVALRERQDKTKFATLDRKTLVTEY